MAQKRMFDRAIIDTDNFMDLSMSAKALYFLLGMEADDEGFVSYKKVMRIHGGNEDDVKILMAKKFIIRFNSGVVVITDWNKNNYLQESRIKPTEYQKERKMLTLTDTQKYELNRCLTSIEEYSIEESSIEENIKTKNKKQKYGEFKNVLLKEEEYLKLKQRIKNVDVLIEDLSQYIASKGKKYKSHYATLLAWNRRRNGNYKSISVIG